MEIVEKKVIAVSSEKKIEKEFAKALKTFLSTDFSEEYKGYQPLGDKILVKLFKFSPRDELKEELGKSEIYVQSKLDGSFKPKSIAMSEKIFPIVKVIKKGLGVNNESIEEGGSYTVPYDEVTGEQWNPDFLHLVQTFSGKSGNQGKLVNVPEDMPQKLPKLYIDWVRYKFSMPDRLTKETDEDKLVYLIPSIKLESIYTYIDTMKL